MERERKYIFCIGIKLLKFLVSCLLTFECFPIFLIILEQSDFNGYIHMVES